MSASIYPALLDTDVQLLRRTPSDTVVPADHNNLVDAIQAIEATIGIVDDGTIGGGDQSFNLGIGDYVAFPGTQSVNPRFPYLPVPDNAWYARAKSTPAAWTLGTGVTASYSNAPGFLELSYTGAAPKLAASCDVAGSAPWDLVFGMRASGPSSGPATVWAVGFSANGTGTDMDGVRMFGNGASGSTVRAVKGGADATPANYIGLGSLAGLCWIHIDATDLKFYSTMDGIIWHQNGSTTARTGQPTKIVVYVLTNASPYAKLYVPFIVQGNANPPGIV